MKKLIFIALMMISASAASYAQKFAFVDSQYILDNITEYQMAQNQLDELAKTWQKEIDAKIADIDKLYKAYQDDAVLLHEDLKRKREDGKHFYSEIVKTSKK